MKIDVTVPMRNLDGEPVPDSSLRLIITESLLGVLRGDEGLDGPRKADLYALAFRIHHDDKPDLKAEEISLIKERIGRAYAPLIVGMSYKLLDPPADDEKK